MRTTGKYGEQFVVRHLQKQGFAILAQNYAKRFGEIDIIARKNSLIIFVEVKTRKSKFIDLTELIRPSKQYKIIMTAKEFAATHCINNTVLRFDVALISIENEKINLEYIPDAFQEIE
jgi:putative endonuclease